MIKGTCPECKVGVIHIIGTCPKCHTTFESLDEKLPFEPEKPALREAAKELLEYIEEENIHDLSCDDGDGHTDEWCSDKFETLINNVKEAL